MRHPPHRAFTLIELLVVVSIIALLISILLPALAAARENARSIQCASNLRQVMFALLSYTHDNQDSLPYSYDYVAASPTVNRQLFWAGRLGSQAGNYLSDPAIFFCPGRDGGWEPALTQMHRPQVAALNVDQYYWHWAYINYSANRYGAMPWYNDTSSSKPLVPVKTTQPNVPASNLLVLAEGYNRTYRNDPADGKDGWYVMTPGFTNDVVFTHGSSASSSYLDGHVETSADKIGWDLSRQAPDGSMGFWKSVMGTERAKAPWYFGIYTK